MCHVFFKRSGFTDEKIKYTFLVLDLDVVFVVVVVVVGVSAYIVAYVKDGIYN